MDGYDFTPEQLHEYDECVKLVNAGETLTAQQAELYAAFRAWKARDEARIEAEREAARAQREAEITVLRETATATYNSFLELVEAAKKRLEDIG